MKRGVRHRTPRFHFYVADFIPRLLPALCEYYLRFANICVRKYAPVGLCDTPMPVRL